MPYVILVIFIFTLEYFIKRHMDQVRTLQQQRPLAGGRLVLKKYYNTGAAGNAFKRHPGYVRCIHTAALLFVAAAMVYTLPKKGARAVKTGLAFLAGGGLSNLYDRLRKGYVVDYFSFGAGPKWFRRLVFNLADFFVFAGVLLGMIQMIRKDGKL